MSFYKKNYKYLILISTIIYFDQISKHYIKNNFDQIINKNILLFSIDYVKNYGAAFNLFNEYRIFLSLVSILTSLFLTYLIFFRNIYDKDKFYLSLILAGSFGNGLDRIFKGFVIDFINLNFINFPVFNISDIAINIGFILLIINIFKNKD